MYILKLYMIPGFNKNITYSVHITSIGDNMYLFPLDFFLFALSISSRFLIPVHLNKVAI